MAKKNKRTAKGGYYSGMPSRKYWEQRAKESLAESFANADEVDAYITATYEKNLREFLEKYKKIIAKYENRDGEIDIDRLNKDLIYDNQLRFKLNRIESEISIIAEQLGEMQESKILSLLEDVYANNYKRTLKDFGVKTPLVALNEEGVEQIVKTPFTKDGREFSDRIWENLDIMQVKLRRVLSDAITNGETPGKTIDKFRQTFGGSNYNARRLIRTETMACHAKASKDAYEKIGVEKVEVLAEHDACPVCLFAAGQTTKNPLKLEDVVVGVNAPPYHPNCRCSITPIKIKKIDFEE